MQDSDFLKKGREMLAQVKGKSLTVEARRELSVELAALMMKESRRTMTHSEKVHADELARMLDDPLGKDFATTLTDEVFRSDSNLRVADQLDYIVHKFGIPKFLSFEKRLQLKAFTLLGRRGASLVVPLVKRMLRKRTEEVIIPAEAAKLKRHIRRRTADKVDLNINYLGEAILGEEEAEIRLKKYLDLLANPKVNYVSVKISSICSQINMLAPAETVEVLAERLRVLYRAAAASEKPKFVNLDMEEYEDLALTVELFKRVLDEPEFLHFSAGIVLQAYLPESYLYQQDLTLWALKRVAGGGAPIKIRLVKGANLAMEQLKGRLKGWPQAPYAHKVDVDANFKRMLAYGCQKENARAVHLGIGSHNLFDVAYALLLRSEQGLEKEVRFEMLEGMASPQCRVVHALSKAMLLYCPIAPDQEFQSAVAYLVRRLDENTSPENFLRHVFNLIPGTREWQQQASLFSLSCHTSQSITFNPRRTQNRLTEEFTAIKEGPFVNEADTDWSLGHNAKWARALVEEPKADEFPRIPLVIQGEDRHAEKVRPILNPSRPEKPLTVSSLATLADLDLALGHAATAETTWGALAVEHRSEILAQVANRLRKLRGKLIRAMVLSSGKLVSEADVEVSEAIDFVEYYRRSALEWHSQEGIAFTPKGVTAVVTPWNFPCAIPVSGIASSLAAGNPVIFKPAPEAVLVGYEVAKAFWEGGVPHDALHFLPMEDAPEASALIQDRRVKKCIFTGSTETALKLLKIRPDLDLSAETGGKNALIVTAMADRDLAIKDIISSAFGYAGQKCSACSLLILEKELYHDKKFLQHLKDAAASMRVGPSTELFTRINPLIHPPEDDLKWALNELDTGEVWLLKPEQDKNNPHLWSPGIKLNVKPGSKSHLTEFFGPVLSVMVADNLDHAIGLANQVPYGLTSGIHSLDEREISRWRKNIRAGNLYINRGITGAIVQRQPFGGFKDSCFGEGFKTGGPHTLLGLMHYRELQPSNAPFQDAWERYFSLKHDPTQILGQHNLLSFVPRLATTLRLQGGESSADIARVLEAFKICDAPLTISSEHEIPDVDFVKESEDELVERLKTLPEKRVRVLSEPTEMLRQKLAEVGATLLAAPCVSVGRLELLHALREVATSYDYHRYGNIPFQDAGRSSC
ncbi:MAG: bifunctional proline dehydrogenase/L-glutamate gamma-semialdehyde dehydrogenase [Chlamydiia bacterium]|nr:bifunctional proline dehydrogenase/L-glutamate gamma-semialdehyde dehydrogenase [Chlamydiia bacterium]